MSIWLLYVVLLCYTGTGIEQLVKGHWMWAGVWLSYAASVVFFILMAKKTGVV